MVLKCSILRRGRSPSSPTRLTDHRPFGIRDCRSLHIPLDASPRSQNCTRLGLSRPPLQRWQKISPGGGLSDLPAGRHGPMPVSLPKAATQYGTFEDSFPQMKAEASHLPGPSNRHSGSRPVLPFSFHPSLAFDDRLFRGWCSHQRARLVQNCGPSSTEMNSRVPRYSPARGQQCQVASGGDSSLPAQTL